MNDYLLHKYLTEYVQWHAQNHRFHDSFQADVNRQYRLRAYTYVYTAAGFCFGATIVNPNFTHRQSYYLRRAWPLVFAGIGFQWGRKLEGHNLLNSLLRMHDYLPLEIKRAMQTKDYRHIQMFDYKNPGRVLFDPVTGKSLS